MPGPGDRGFQQAYHCQTVVDSAYQVIVAARAINMASDKQQAVSMVAEAIAMWAQCPRRLPPTPATTRRGQWRTPGAGS